MSRNDLILTLVRAGAAGDKALLQSTVEALAADERSKNHTTLADRLTRAAKSNGVPPKMTFYGGGAPISDGQEFILDTQPRRTLAGLTLPATVCTEVEHVIEEQSQGDLLRSHGLQPRHRLLLSGPPGNGKSALAEAIAEGLGLPLRIVRYEALIGSFLGETTQRLARMFDHVKRTPCVLFFDEFDVVGKERGDVHETGEIKRVVSSLLMQVDALPSHVVVVTATNHPELLDRAVWRRFQVRLELPLPSKAERQRFLMHSFQTMPDLPKADAARVAARLGPVSYAEMEEFILDLRRRHVLALGKKRFAEVLAEILPLWSARVKVQSYGERSDKASAEIRPRQRRGQKKGTKSYDSVPADVHTGPAKKGSRTEVHGASKGPGRRSKPSRASR